MSTRVDGAESVRPPTPAEIEECTLRLISDESGSAASTEYYEAVLGARARFELADRVSGCNAPVGVNLNDDVFLLLNPHHREDASEPISIRSRMVRLNDVVRFVRRSYSNVDDALIRGILRCELDYLRGQGVAIGLTRRVQED